MLKVKLRKTRILINTNMPDSKYVGKITHINTVVAINKTPNFNYHVHKDDNNK